MDESDGVIGVAAIRQTQPTLIEQILIHESLGKSSSNQEWLIKFLQKIIKVLRSNLSKKVNLISVASQMLVKLWPWFTMLNCFIKYQTCIQNLLSSLQILIKPLNNFWIDGKW